MTTSALRAALLLACACIASPALAQKEVAPDLQGATILRLDEVDTAGVEKGELIFYGSFLDKRRKPIVVTEAPAWTATIDGETPQGELTIKQLSESDKGINLVVVIATYENMPEEQFDHQVKGVARLLNGLRPNDRSAVVAIGKTVEATGGLSPSHNESSTWVVERKREGPTPLLYEAIDKALDFFPTEFTAVSPNRAILVVSDGTDKALFEPSKLRNDLNGVQNKALKRRVRVSAIGVKSDDPAGLEHLQKLVEATRGTYRLADSGQDIETFLTHAESELSGQHVIRLMTQDFEGEKDTTFKLSVTQDAQKYDSGPLVRWVDKKKNNWPFYAAVAGGGLGGALLLFFLIRTVVRLSRSKDDDAPVQSGPDKRPCPQCNNVIPVDWKVCQFCEALPHKGRLKVVSSGPLNGRAFFIKESLTNIGSADGNAIVVNDKSVSKRHAGIKVQDNRFELADFGSTNGVMVNGQRITKLFLKSGDVISIGAVELEFTLK